MYFLNLQVENGHIKRLTDDNIKSSALEISGANVATTYITTPINCRASLAIKLPFLVLIIKNMNQFFSFEVQVTYFNYLHIIREKVFFSLHTYFIRGNSTIATDT